MSVPAEGAPSAEKIEEWIKAAQQGSREALGQLLETCRLYLLLVANQSLDTDLRAKVGASDLVQETFLEAQRDFEQFQGCQQAELLAWLRRILLNNMANASRQYVITQKRQLAREITLTETPSGKSPEAVDLRTKSPSSRLNARDEAEVLEKALKQLPEHYREVITLRHQANCTFEEIGQRLGRSAGAARKLWARVGHAQNCLGEVVPWPKGGWAEGVDHYAASCCWLTCSRRPSLPVRHTSSVRPATMPSWPRPNRLGTVTNQHPRPARMRCTRSLLAAGVICSTNWHPS